MEPFGCIYWIVPSYLEVVFFYLGFGVDYVGFSRLGVFLESFLFFFEVFVLDFYFLEGLTEGFWLALKSSN